MPHGSGEFAYLRQNVRQNNAAITADYAVKPTSGYSVERVESKLEVVAISEGVPRYWFVDTVALQGFLANELDYGLRIAVEAKVLADINGTSARHPGVCDESPCHA